MHLSIKSFFIPRRLCKYLEIHGDKRLPDSTIAVASHKLPFSPPTPDTSPQGVTPWHHALPTCSRYNQVPAEELESLLDRFWRVDAHGSCLTNAAKEERDCEQRSQVYGEVTPLGARQLACAIFGEGEAKEVKDEAVFADLGSGTGKLVAQMWLENPFLARVVGVEISKLRHDIAVASFKEMMLSKDVEYFQALVTARRSAKPTFVCGDFIETDLDAVSHMFAASLCFTNEIMEMLGARLLTLPRLEVVASLRRISQLENGGNWRREGLEMETSWGGATCYIYRKGS